MAEKGKIKAEGSLVRRNEGGATWEARDSIGFTTNETGIGTPPWREKHLKHIKKVPLKRRGRIEGHNNCELKPEQGQK